MTFSYFHPSLISRTYTENPEGKEASYVKLELLGYKVGYSLVEKFTKDRPRFIDNLDVVKYLCKQLWQLFFQKQVDNLKTNNKGVYVLQDNTFRWFNNMSAGGGSAETTKRCLPVCVGLKYAFFLQLLILSISGFPAG